VALLYGAQRDEACRFAENVRLAIEAHDFSGRNTEPGLITLSGGVASLPTDAADDLALIKAADANLYRAKEEGRNRVVPKSAD
jgi:diguanylate cyclase (GGDEF)-like protein